MSPSTARGSQPARRNLERSAGDRAGRIISVGGGKGGVGKSLLAANLGVALAQKGARVVIVDADLGGANQHAFFGIRRILPSLQDFFEHNVEGLAALKVQTGVPGLELVPGIGNVPGAANINHGQKLRLLRHIAGLEAEVVIVDVGAGIGFNTIDLFNAGDLRLVVLTPQLTSLQNGYGFLKASVYRSLQQIAVARGEPDLMERLGKLRDSERLPQAIDSLAKERPAVGDAMRAELSRFGAKLVGNQTFGASESGTFHAVSRMVRDFLGLSVPLLGALRASRGAHDSVNAGRPFALAGSSPENQRILHEISHQLLAETVLRGSREVVEAGGTSELVANAPASLPLEQYERTHHRHAVCWTGQLRGVGETTLEVEIRDISDGGVGIYTTGGALSIGQSWRLTFETPGRSYTVAAVVRHVGDGGVAGLEFVDPIPGFDAAVVAAKTFGSSGREQPAPEVAFSKVGVTLPH